MKEWLGEVRCVFWHQSRYWTRVWCINTLSGREMTRELCLMCGRRWPHRDKETEVR